MRLFKYALLLVVLIGFVSIAAADLFGTYLTGTNAVPGIANTFYSGSASSVTVTTYSEAAHTMVSIWSSPSFTSSPKQLTVTRLSNGSYMGTCTYSPVNTEGYWNVWVHDSDSDADSVTVYFWVQGTAAYTSSITKTTNTVRAIITPPTSSSGSYMKFYWYSSTGTCIKTSDPVAKGSDGKYEDNLNLGTGGYTGGDGWYIKFYEYSDISCSDSSRVGAQEEEFDEDDIPEFPIGSFIPLLLTGIVYLKIRRNRRVLKC